MGCEFSLCFAGLPKEKKKQHDSHYSTTPLHCRLIFMCTEIQICDLRCGLRLLSSITLPVFLCQSPQVALVKVLVAGDPQNLLRQITNNGHGPEETGEQNRFGLTRDVVGFSLSKPFSLSL